MRHVAIGMVIGLIAGIIIGATVVRPKIAQKSTSETDLQSEQVSEKAAIQQANTIDDQPPLNTGTSNEITQETAKEEIDNNKPSAPVRWRITGAYSGVLPILGELPSKLEKTLNIISDGRFEVTFHEPGTLVPPSDLIDAVRSGTIQAAFSSPAIWADKNTALQLFSSVPFGPHAREYLAWFYQGGGREIFEEVYNDQGIHSLICGVTTQEASGWFKHPVTTVDQLTGMRMRISGLGARVMEKLGVTTEFLANDDIIVAMNSGVIDAAEFSQPATDFALGLHQTANIVYFPGWHQPVALYDLIINKDAWDELPAALQTQIETTCGDNVRHGMTSSDSRQFSTLKQYTELGVQMKTWPPNLMAAYRKTWDGVVKEQVKANKDFRRIWTSLQKFREEFAIWQELSAP